MAALVGVIKVVGLLISTGKPGSFETGKNDVACVNTYMNQVGKGKTDIIT